MQPAAKRCLRWAALSAIVGIALEAGASGIMNAIYSAWIVNEAAATIPGWATVLNAALGALTRLPLLIAAALVGAAVVINVLAPRTSSPAERGEATEAVDRDAVDLARTSRYEPGVGETFP